MTPGPPANDSFHAQLMENTMSYVAATYKKYEGTSVGDGQCVAFVRAASGAPQTTSWVRGEQVKSASGIAVGAVIATFDSNGKYGSRKDGTSHTAIFLRKTAVGIVVLDQWITHGVRQPVHERTIRFNNAAGKKINNGDEYYVVK